LETLGDMAIASSRVSCLRLNAFDGYFSRNVLD
jgi:hypothetical protein